MHFIVLLLLGITQSAVECLAQLYAIDNIDRATARDIITQCKIHFRMTNKMCAIFDPQLQLFYVQMDTSPLSLYYRYVSEETRRWSYKASDKVWICHGEVCADDEAQRQNVPRNFFHRLYVQIIFRNANCLAVLLHRNLRCSPSSWSAH